MKEVVIDLRDESREEVEEVAPARIGNHEEMKEEDVVEDIGVFLEDIN